MVLNKLKSLALTGLLALSTSCATTSNSPTFEPPTLNIETRITTGAGDSVSADIEVKKLYDLNECSKPYNAIQFSGDSIKNPNGREVIYPIGFLQIIDCEGYSRTVFF